MKETIKKLRDENHYSQATVATYLNISRQMYIKYESGDVEPPVSIVKQLSNLYKVSYEFIIDNKAVSKQMNYSKKSDDLELLVKSPEVSYGKSSNNNFDLALSAISSLNIFDQIKLIGKLAEIIGTKGPNQIVSENTKQTSLNNLSMAEKDRLFEKYTGILSGKNVDDARSAKKEHLYRKHNI